MKLSLARESYRRIRIEKRDDAGELKAVTCHAFNSERDYRRAAVDLGVARELLLRHVDAFRASGASECEIDITGVRAPFTVSVRGRLQQAAGSSVFESEDPVDALEKAIAAGPPAAEDPIIEWTDETRLACVDVDFHMLDYDSRYPPSQLEALAARIEPTAVLSWPTHGRGLRLVYGAMEGFTAMELAAVACISLQQAEPWARLELKTDTRHPGSVVNGRTAGPVIKRSSTSDVGVLRRWFGEREVDDRDVAEWLAQHAMQPGGRYPHSMCPAAPHVHGKRDPVIVRDGGIYCHVCSGNGVTRGHRIPGWFPWGALLGAPISSVLRRCIDACTHWAHAQHVVSECSGLDGPVARAAYSAALKLAHGDTPNVSQAFSPDLDFIRMRGYWTTPGGEPLVKQIRPMLRRLPACTETAADGSCRVREDRVALFDQAADLSDYGYPALTPIYGCKIYGHHLPLTNPNRVNVVVHQPEFAGEHMTRYRPKYIPGTAADEEAAWAVLEQFCPGLDRDFITLLIAAKGIVEGEFAMPPFLFVSGPTSAAKSTSVLLAATVCGDRASSVVWTSNSDRVRQALYEAKATGTFVTFNEVIKESSRRGASSVDAMDFILNLTPESLSHRLYVGAVRLGTLPVCVWTDTAVPIEIRQSAQLARRLIHVHLPRQVDWQAAMRDTGLGRVEVLRTHSPVTADACNMVLSSVIRRFFQRVLTFEEIAAELGYKTLAQSDEAAESAEQLREFFKRVCEAPALTGADESRWSGRGWKLVHRDCPSPLLEMWMSVCDSTFVSSRKCSETDWAKLVGVDRPVTFEVRHHGNDRLAVRFIHRRSKKDYDVNSELLVPVTTGVHRPGDAVGP